MVIYFRRRINCRLLLNLLLLEFAWSVQTEEPILNTELLSIGDSWPVSRNGLATGFHLTVLICNGKFALLTHLVCQLGQKVIFKVKCTERKHRKWHSYYIKQLPQFFCEELAVLVYGHLYSVWFKNGHELFSRDVARPVFRLGLFTISHYIISRPWPDPMSSGAMFFKEIMTFARE